MAGTPRTIERLQKLGFEVLVQSGAGTAADFSDEAYTQAGASIAPDAASLWSRADVVLKVRPPTTEEVPLVRAGQTLLCFLWPAQNETLVAALAARQATVLAMDAVPRITRAQKCDALSSMANIAGYRAIIEAANRFGRFFTGQVTAAGSMPPAKVLVIGAGVAGLAAVGAARSLGAIVRAFDTRPVVKEQVESMGAEFLEVEMTEDGTGQGGYARQMSKEFIEKEMALFLEQAREVDIIVTTALIPGKPAPELIRRDMVEAMKPGSVVVDLAAERGGNCALTRADEVVEHKGRLIIGYTDLPSRMAHQSSELYGTNLYHLLDELGGAGGWKVDHANEIVRGALVLEDGKLMWPPPATETPVLASPEPAPKDAAGRRRSPTIPAAAVPGAAVTTKEKKKSSPWPVLGLLALVLVGASFGSLEFLTHLTVFVLACFVGWQVVWNVAAALHTPLMSVTNAISGIILVGGILQVTGHGVTTWLGAVAVLVASINIAGGFLVTRRMLEMFRRD